MESQEPCPEQVEEAMQVTSQVPTGYWSGAQDPQSAPAQLVEQEHVPEEVQVPWPVQVEEASQKTPQESEGKWLARQEEQSDPMKFPVQTHCPFESHDP